MSLARACTGFRIDASSRSVSLSREKRTTHRNITERSPVKVEHPVIFKLGDRTLLVRTLKKHDLFSDVRSTLDDIIELADIEEVRKVSMGTEGDGISILVHGESTARQFLVTSRRDETFSVSSIALWCTVDVLTLDLFTGIAQ